MSINHLCNFIGENFNIGCSKFSASDSIVFGANSNHPVGIKTPLVSQQIARKIIWGETITSLAGTSGIVNNCWSYQWDPLIAGRCIVTLLEVGANLQVNGPPLIMANCRNVPGDLSLPTSGCYVNSATVISSIQIQIETANTVPINRQFMLCVVY